LPSKFVFNFLSFFREPEELEGAEHEVPHVGPSDLSVLSLSTPATAFFHSFFSSTFSASSSSSPPREAWLAPRAGAHLSLSGLSLFSFPLPLAFAFPSYGFRLFDIAWD
jgi:hypothetical protein